MRFGLALPQYDYSVAGERPLQFETIVEYARAAEAAGFDSVWLSDHLFLDLAKYGGPPDREACFEPLVTLAALAGRSPASGSARSCCARRCGPASVLAKALATLDRICGGRLDVGLGAGWYEPEYEAIGMDDAAAGRAARRGCAKRVEVVSGLLGGGPFTFDGRYHRAARRGRTCPPRSSSRGRRVFVGGKGDRLLRLVAEHADGWNTCWTWTPDAYRERLDVLEPRVRRGRPRSRRRCGARSGSTRCAARTSATSRGASSGWPASAPAGVLDGVDLEEFRDGRLVGTVEQVREQAASGRRSASTR